MTNQPKRETNIDAFVAYFERGCKPDASHVGIELEHMLVRTTDKSAVTYRECGGAKWVLEQLAPRYDTVTYAQDGEILGLSKPGVALTLEPAAQLEISAGPFDDLNDARACLESFETDLHELLEPLGVEAVLLGYHPSAHALDLPLIPKARYEYMNRYFAQIGPWGQRMMRATGSTQVSIDYTSLADAARKMRLVSAAVPLLSLWADNTPFFEGAPSPHPLMRTEIWKYCDPARCNIARGVFEPGYSVIDYAAYILDTPAIVAPDGAGGYTYDTRAFGEIYADTVMTDAQITHALGMVFPDVRLKQYIEIRPADALPVPRAVEYAALIKGLFCNAAALDKLEELFEGVRSADVAAAKESLMQHGSSGVVYGRPAQEMLEQLVSIAQA